jgi:hypothetical protein
VSTSNVSGLTSQIHDLSGNFILDSVLLLVWKLARSGKFHTTDCTSVGKIYEGRLQISWTQHITLSSNFVEVR